MAHHHHHEHAIPLGGNLNKVFIWGILLNVVFVIAEAVAGWLGGSMALLSDAGHNLSDVVSLALALMAIRLTMVASNSHYTYGYKKSTILASLTNAVILVIAVVFIIIESIDKIKNPRPVDGAIVAWVAAIGIVINGVTAYLFFKQRSQDLNVKGAFMHMLADTLVSVGVLLSGLIVSITGWTLVDPIVGISIGVIILISTWNLLTQSLRLTLDGVPEGIDVGNITHKLCEISGVDSVHHIHVWAISTTENAITVHVVTSQLLTEIPALKETIKHFLADNGINHATLEFETPLEECCNKDC
ncbi:MAG: cation diffusion facilitator family transporter [Muribaculaceae bacterium]